MTVPDHVRVLLLQTRNPQDQMIRNEVECFARALGVEPGRIGVVDLLDPSRSGSVSKEADLFLFGGSGDYSVHGEHDWLLRVLDLIGELRVARRAVFASCWGFQAVARALGGRVERDPALQELGTLQLTLTEAGKTDPVFGELGERFLAQVGHEDTVVELPEGAVGLASSERVENHAYRLEDAPMLCTQFHPELRASDLLARLRAYPRYVEQISGLPAEEFFATVKESPETEGLVGRFVESVFGREGDPGRRAR